MTKALINAGVDRELASKKSNDILNPSSATFMEIYGRGNIVRVANESRRDLNVEGLGAFDIRTTKADGSHWDFNKCSDRKEVMKIIDEQDPFFVVGSPPCTAFCSWSRNMNYPKMDPKVVAELVKEG